MSSGTRAISLAGTGTGPRRRTPLGPRQRPDFQTSTATALTRGRALPVQNINLTANSPSDEANPAISPDGRKILFASNGEDSNNDGVIDRVRNDRTFHIWLMDADGSNKRQLTTDAGNQVEPAWSPSGDRFAYASNEGRDYDIYIVALASGVKTKVSLGTSQERHPSWSPGGDRLALMSDSGGGHNQIWVVKSDGTSPQCISNGVSEDTNPSWSPNGQYVAFQSDGQDSNADGIIDRSGGPTNIWVMSPGGTQQHAITGVMIAGNYFTNTDPSWSKDGTRVIFASNRRDSDGNGTPDTLGSFDAYAIAVTQPETAAATTAQLITPRPAAAPNPIVGDVKTPVIFPDTTLDPKVVFANDTTGSADIWMTSMSDSTPPNLDDLPSVTPRLSSPGATVTITAHVSDQESGVKAVYAQIRDPDDAATDALGQDHKCYSVTQGTPGAAAGKINIWSEVDSQMVDATNYTYLMPPYTAPIGDYMSAQPPSPGWLQLFDDGQHNDGAAGDGVYGSNWKTPTNAPSDFVLDIVTYDNAGQWRIYDNIWGFSTQQFAAQHNLLLVMDYAAGQKFMTGLRSNYWSAGYWPTWQPVESYFTRNPTGRSFVPGTYTNNVYNMAPGTEPAPNPLGVEDMFDPNRYYGEGDTDGYDLWRTQCRGPVPADVINLYGARKVQQPNFTDPFKGAPQDQLVADRGIFWVSPYAGDLWVGEGTIADTTTQVNLTNFLSNGGRLVMTGQDIAWALSRDNAVSSPLLAKMGVQYVDDASQNAVTRMQWQLRVTMNGLAGDPVVTEPWGPHYGADPGFPTTLHMPEAYTAFLLPSQFSSGLIPYLDISWDTAGQTGDQPYTDAAGNQYWMDSVTPIAPAVGIYTYANNIGVNGQNTGLAGVRLADATTKARSVFFGIGLEGVSNEFVASDNFINAPHSHNVRGRLAHNSICWTRTGTLYGVVTTADGQAAKGVLVQAYEDYNPGNGPLAGQAFTQADGSYVIEGLQSSIYRIVPYLPGFTYDHAHRLRVHGGGRSNESIKISQAPAGSLSGRVTGPDGTTAIQGATVTVDLQGLYNGAAVNKSVQSDQFGNYQVANLPVGNYTVKASADGYPDRTYGTLVIVNSGVDTPNINFAMGGSAGSITGIVTRDSDGQAVAGATVELRSSAAIAIATATTDTTGTYAFPGVNGGTYDLVITAGPGILATPPVSVTFGGSGQLRKDLVARTGAGTIIAGTVRDSAGTPITGANVDVLLNGAVTKTVQSGTVQVDGTHSYNYILSGLAAGVYDIRASKTGSQGTSTRVSVQQGDQLYNVDLTLDVLHVFSSGLAMVSSPYDYSATDVTALLGLTAGSVKLAAFDAARGDYAYYPQAPSDRLRPGVGYFMLLNQPISLSSQGRTTDSSKPYSISLQAGWNMIGNPFPFIVNWFDTQVKYGTKVLTLQDAIGQDLVKNALWTYSNGSYRLVYQLLPWEGYWVKCTQPVTLLISNQPGRSAVPDPFRSRTATEDSWSLQLVTRAGQLSDQSNYLGVSRQAHDDYDPTSDVLKPPPAMGQDTLTLSFPHDSGWGANSGDYAVDMRSAVAGEKIWPFVVKTTLPNQTVTVSWPNVGQLPKRYTAILEDTDSGARRYLRSLGAYSFVTGPNGAERHFRLRVTTQMATRLALSNLRVTQNRAVGGAALSFDLSEPASVRATIIGVNGRVIREVSSRQVMSSGTSSVTWDGRDARGVSLRSGFYMFVIEASAEDGRSVQQVQPFVKVQ